MSKFLAIITFLFVILAMPLPILAVKLADGEAVGAILGYSSACMKHIGYNPPKNNDDKVAGERYGAWVKKNTANPGQVMKKLGHGLHLGMLSATQSDYAHCESVIREMIGFYEFFKISGDHWRPALKKFSQVSQAKKPSQAQQAPPQDDSLPLGKYKQCTGMGATPEARCLEDNSFAVSEVNPIELRQDGRGTYFGSILSA